MRRALASAAVGAAVASVVAGGLPVSAEETAPAAVEVTAAAVHPAPAVLFVADLTAKDGRDEWPVAAAVRNWNRNGRVVLTLVESCVDRHPCVDVVEAPAGTGTWLGWAETIRPHDRYQVLLNASHFDRAWFRGPMRPLQRSLVCHELGHVLLGDAHRDGLGSCLSTAADPAARYAGPMLLAELRNLAASPG